MNIIYNEDCLERMRKIGDNSIDMICTDPPYFLDGFGENWDKLKSKGVSKTVSHLPKGMKFDRTQSVRFRKFYSDVSQEAFRILKPGGSFLSFSSPRLYHAMAIAIEDSGFEIRDMLGWIYIQSQVKAFSQNHIIDKDKTRTEQEKTNLKMKCVDWKTSQLKPAIEPICFAVKPIEGRYIDNFDKYGTGLMNTSQQTKVGINRNYFPSNVLVTDENKTSNLLDETNVELQKVFLVSKPSRTEKGVDNYHPTVKPIELISHLIRLFTVEGAIVLDPFIGSGTTAIACILTNRVYIGIEKNKEYVDITTRRINEWYRSSM